MNWQSSLIRNGHSSLYAAKGRELTQLHNGVARGQWFDTMCTG